MTDWFEDLNARIANGLGAPLTTSPAEADIEERIAVLSEALKSIAKNTCCDNCQEAARVARAALGAYVGLARTPSEPAMTAKEAIEAAARIVENWSLPTIQTPSMWLVDKAGIAADIRYLALSSHDRAPQGE